MTIGLSESVQNSASLVNITKLVKERFYYIAWGKLETKQVSGAEVPFRIVVKNYPDVRMNIDDISDKREMSVDDRNRIGDAIVPTG